MFRLGIPVFTIENDEKNSSILEIVHFFGKNTVHRIINANFIDDAIKFGTDKGRVDEHDFRRVVEWAGFDICGVEEQANKQGYNKSDTFCGTPYSMFERGDDEFNSNGLGIPNDRSAILIYDSSKLEEVKGSERMGGISDGYIFKDIENKKEALLAIIKFKEKFLDFEKELYATAFTQDKISILEREVFENLNTCKDLKNAPYLSLNIVELLYSQSVKNVTYPSEELIDSIDRLKKISERLKYEIRMINFVDNMLSQISMTHEVFRTDNKRKMKMMKTWPDFVIRTTQEFLQETEDELDEKYTNILLAVIAGAEACKVELDIN